MVRPTRPSQPLQVERDCSPVEASPEHSQRLRNVPLPGPLLSNLVPTRKGKETIDIRKNQASNPVVHLGRRNAAHPRTASLLGTGNWRLLVGCPQAFEGPDTSTNF